MRKLAALILAGVLTGSSALHAQVPDPNVRLQQLQVVALQRFETEFRKVQTATATLSPDKAKSQWKQLQLLIDSDTLLPGDVRRSMTQRIQEQIALLTPQPMATPSATKGSETSSVARDANRRAAERSKEEAAQLRAWLGRISALHQAGQLLEAERQSLEMSRLYPDNAAAQTMNHRATMNVRLSEARDLIADQEKRANAVFIDVQEASLPVVGDVEFPKDWKEKSERRNQSTLTAKEQAIMKALDGPINVDYRNKPFLQLVQELSDGMKLPIILDKQALEELEVDSSTMATLKLTGVSTRTALRKLLSDYGLVYVIKNEAILVTSQTKAKEMLVTRVYYLGDLVRLSGPFSGAPRFGPVVDELQTQENARVLLDIIQTSIDPNSWRANGGLGTLTYHAPTASLIVRQSAEVHALMGSKFSK